MTMKLLIQVALLVTTTVWHHASFCQAFSTNLPGRPGHHIPTTMIPQSAGIIKKRPATSTNAGISISQLTLSLPMTLQDEEGDDSANDHEKPVSKPAPTKSSLASVASTKSSSSSSTTKLTKTASTKPSRWDSFDYLQHWYPVVWACDVRPNRPTQVTLLDVNYVITYDTERDQWTALEDKCPHKAAALSEGRLTSSGFIQCAYHGWSFDGTNGDCVQIPQAVTNPANKQESFPSKACAKPVPIRDHQTMIWLWPGPIPANGVYPDPPTIPEMDLPGWNAIRVVRDFPMVDWPLLVSNILDPDHGAFAHQNLAFDFYTASPSHPLEVEETFQDAGWEFQASVSAVDKVLAVDQQKRQLLGLKTKKKKEPKKMADTASNNDLLATSHFMAPTTVSLCRRNATDGTTKFITAFWVCPTGTGQSRFMSAAISKLPLKIPRWILQLNLNRFLDQDTVLVASQQPPLLTAEAQGVEKPRSSLFAYASATDKTVRLIDAFWDATLHKVPRRAAALQHLYQSGALQQTPSREVVLDRRVQHLNICPDSQGLVRNCKILTRVGLAATALWIGQTLWQRSIQKVWMPLLTTLIAYVADQIRKQFYFVKTEASRDKDLSQIPVKAWLDP